MSSNYELERLSCRLVGEAILKPRLKLNFSITNFEGAVKFEKELFPKHVEEVRAAAMESWLYSVLPELAPIEADIHSLVDIRSLPGSNKYPYFNSENLASVLLQNGLQYFWLPKLGGLRRPRKDFPSVNKGLTSPSFGSYADYMATEEFREGVQELIEIASQSATAYMCAEAVYWRCH